ncbi:elongation factor P--(R)-beta-lysine ligase [Aurantivibrio infirmus]
MLDFKESVLMVDWTPTATLSALFARDQLYKDIRRFFARRNYLEVETPILGIGGTTDPHIQSFRTEFQDTQYYLQTSPEFFMKRLLAAGSGPIFALTKAFRQEEVGRFHNPEFTLLEWYMPGFDDHRLMEEVGEFLVSMLGLSCSFISYREIFQKVLGVDPHLAGLVDLKSLAKKHLDCDWQDEDRNTWLDALFSHVIQPGLTDGIIFVFDYPASQAALAKITTAENGIKVARRFEVFVNGVELANGYWELTDAKEQEQRFHNDQQKRKELGLAEINSDDQLIQALASGLPDCAGVALGVDRLLMLKTNSPHIKDVLSFPVTRL